MSCRDTARARASPSPVQAGPAGTMAKETRERLHLVARKRLDTLLPAYGGTHDRNQIMVRRRGRFTQLVAGRKHRQDTARAWPRPSPARSGPSPARRSRRTTDKIIERTCPPGLEQAPKFFEITVRVVQRKKKSRGEDRSSSDYCALRGRWVYYCMLYMPFTGTCYIPG